MKKYLAVSIILHLSLLLISAKSTSNLLDQGGPGKGGSNRHGGVTIDKDVIPKDKATEVSIIEKNPDIIIKKTKQKIADKECPGKWYGGIGIQTAYKGTEVIDLVYPGYPADLAGLRPGDVITSNVYIPGTPGTMVTLQILRDGIMRIYSIIRGKICY